MQPLPLLNQFEFELRSDFSRSTSLSILDENLDDISIIVDDHNPIEIFIPRDPSLLIPPMILNNVTLIDDHRLFHFHLININQLSTNKHFSLSLHFQIRPININISYLFIYKFDIPFMLDRLMDQIDGYQLFCPRSKYDF
jgi:hypothetical protein